MLIVGNIGGMDGNTESPAANVAGRPGDADAVFARVGASAAADAGVLDVSLLGAFLPDLADAVAAGKPLPTTVLDACRDSGEQAARAGVALPAILDLYLSAGWRLWRHLPAVHDAANDPGAVVTAAEVMLHAVDDGVAALADGYHRARRVLMRQQESARREFVDDLLSGSADVPSLIERATGYGLDLAGPHAVAVVAAERPLRDGGPVATAVERVIDPAGQALVASKNGRLVVVFAAATGDTADRTERILTAALQPGATRGPKRVDVGAWRAGIGRAAAGPAGVAASYREALASVDVAGRLALPEQVAHARDLLAYQMLLRERAAVTDLVATVLFPLTGARGGPQPLLDTLAAYFEAGGNTSRAARVLFLSVRALTYRLERIRILTGLDPTDPADRFTLHTAVIGARLIDWPATPLTAPTGVPQRFRKSAATPR